MMIRRFWAFTMCLVLGPYSYAQTPEPVLTQETLKAESQVSLTGVGPSVKTRKLLAELDDSAAEYQKLGQYDKALPLRIRTLAIRERVLGPEHAHTTATLNELAIAYRDLGRFDEALPLHVRSLLVWEKVIGPEHPDTATGLNNLAVTYMDLGRYSEALPLQIRSLAIREKVFGPEHPDTAIGLDNLARTYMNLGRYNEALPLQIRSLAIREMVLGPEHRDTAIGLGNLAGTYMDLGRYSEALPLFIRSLAITEKALGPEHPDTATGLGDLALTYMDLGRYNEALSLQIRSLAIKEKVFGPEHPSTAIGLGNLASTYMNLGRYNEALSLQIRSLAIKEKVFGPEHPSTATGLGNLAETYKRLSRYEEAMPLYIRSLAIREKVLGPEHPDTALSLYKIAKLFEEIGRIQSAIVFSKLSVNAYQSVRNRVSRIGVSELEGYTEKVSPAYQYLSTILTAEGRLAEAQQVLDMLKENEQFEFIRRAPEADSRKSKIGYTTTEQALVNRYREISDKLGKLRAEQHELEKQAKLGLTPAQKIRQQALEADIKVANAAFTTNLDEMRESFTKAGPARKVEVEEISAQTIRDMQSLIKGLGNDVVLVHYYLTENRVNMLVTTPGIQLARHSEMDTKDLNRKISELRRLLQDPKSNPLPAAQALYEALIAPIAKDLEDAGARNVMLSLDGTLRYLPFSALHDGKQYLAQRWNLPIYTSVTKNRLRDPVAGQWQAAGLGVTKAWPEFPALAGVKAEMEGIVGTPTGGVMPGEVYLDDGFTAQRLRSVSQRQFPVMHLASHFRFSPGTEVNSFLLLGDGQRLTLGDIRTQNYRFDNVDLLTLSACDTGLGGGRDAQGKEIEGFGVIAQQQGAKAVLATLWPVADQSTASLMVDMYRRRQDLQVSKIEALRQAQLALQAQPKYAHPYYWAPFILMGNWK